MNNFIYHIGSAKGIISPKCPFFSFVSFIIYFLFFVKKVYPIKLIFKKVMNFKRVTKNKIIKEIMKKLKIKQCTDKVVMVSLFIY
jgi:hypothetical protein